MSRVQSAVAAILLCVAVSLVMPVPAGAQLARGTLTGTVRDASAAVVANATVTATNVDTQGKWNVGTSGSGVYTFADLPPGTYDVAVNVTGFRQFIQRGVTVRVGDTASLDIALQIGEAQQTVEVVADASQVKADTTEVGTSVSSKTILDLPLQVGGQVRNPIQFIQLTPGFAGDANNNPFSVASFKLNGGQSGGADVLVDGATVQLASPSLQVNYGVSVEGVQEFKVMTNTFSAEYGRTGGGLVNLVTKSGTNELHGTAYDFLRNRVLDANSFFGNARGVEKSINTQNDFGGLIAGPVYLPKIYNGKNKTFFMFDYEGFRFRTGGTGLATYPIDAFRTGDFSQLLPATVIYDPQTCVNGTCQPFPDNKIPADRLSSVSKALNQYLPNSANNDLVNNSVLTSSHTTSANLWTAKIDQVISDKQRISGSVSFDNRPVTDENSRGPLFTSKANQFTRYARLSHDYTISPTLLNHVNLGFSRRFREELDGFGTFGKNIPEKIGLNGVAAQTTVPCVEWQGMPRVFGCGASQFADNTYQLNDNVSWVRGRHSMKFGFELRQQEFNTRRLTYTSGSWTFAPNETGNGSDSTTGYSYASYMLGLVHNGFMNLGKGAGLRSAYYSWFAQDDFKVSDKITLNLGLRYEIPVPTSEAHDRISWMDPTLPNPGADGRPGAYVFAGSGSGRTGRTRPQDYFLKSFGPRVGIAYQVRPGTVIRSGYGIYYSALKVSGFADYDNLGFFGQANFNSPGGNTPAFAWDGGIPHNYPVPPFIDPTVQNGSNPTMILADTGRPGTIQNWTLDIQQQLGKNLLVDVAYVGAHGDHLQSYMRNPNQALPQYMSKGTCLYVDIAQQGSDPRCTGQALVPLPYPSFTGTVGQALRPFPQYQSVFLENSFSPQPFGFYTYHAMQAKVEKRFSQGLTFLVSYTVSKNLTNADSEFPSQSAWQLNNAGPTLDSYNQKNEKALSQLDIPQRLIFSYTYDLPIGPGKPFLNQGGVAGKIAGGWHVSGIQEYHSGVPMGVLAYGVDTGIFADAASPRGNVVPGVSEKGWSGKFDPFKDRFFNPAAFSVPANFTFGNAPRSLPLRDFATLREDFVLGKRTSFGEKANLDFQASFFNAFNRHKFIVGNINVNDPNGFGVVSDASGPRSIQFGLKLNF